MTDRFPAGTVAGLRSSRTGLAARPSYDRAMQRAAVLTVSDGVAAGVREDASGASLAEMLTSAGYSLEDRQVVPDDRNEIEGALRTMAASADLIVTTGGTGFGPRDVTPEATRAVIEREAPGLAEAMRAAGLASTPMAALSRAVAGVLGETLIVNLPGSPRGARHSLQAIMAVLPHALELLSGHTEHKEAPPAMKAAHAPDDAFGSEREPPDGVAPLPESIEALQQALAEHAYLADRGLATSIFLALSLGQPLLLEGEAGVGKTEVAKALAETFDLELIRLQCYEGIDASQALYEWDYARQLLYVRALSAEGIYSEQATDEVFGPRFLLERPLLKGLRAGRNAVLLIDEVDRADDEFEAFLLEVLSDFQVTIPEVGTIRAAHPPIVVLTSNRTRELHDALKRRCLYHWIDFPNLERELEIVKARAPEVSIELATKVAEAVERLRTLDLLKNPGVAETIGWAKALAFLGVSALDRTTADPTLGTVIKDHDDLLKVRNELDAILGDA